MPSKKREPTKKESAKKGPTKKKSEPMPEMSEPMPMMGGFSRSNPRYRKQIQDEGLVIYADECKGNWIQRKRCIAKKKKEYRKNNTIKYSTECQMLPRNQRRKCYKKLNKGLR